MALLQTPPKNEQFQALDFSLPGTDGKTYALKDVAGKNGTLVMFICNHCPYVLAIIERLVKEAAALQKEGVGVVTIMPNDTNRYPADSFENMKAFASEHGFTFPYLIDESQQTARGYGGVCTPDFFGFDGQNKLIYRGRLDSAGKGASGPDTKRELFEAMTGKSAANVQQFPSMGCSIKWRE